MRIDLHIGSREVTESSRSGASSGTAKKKASAGAPAQEHSDEAKRSVRSSRGREVAPLVAKVPSSAMLADGLARADLLRR